MATKPVSLSKTRMITMTGLFAAMIFVFTAYLHIPTGAGYTHAGDGLVYLAACLLPAPYAVSAAVIAGALADCLSGFPVWVPATLVIKAATALFFSNRTEKIICLRNIVAVVPSLVVCIVGYSVYEGTVIVGGFSPEAVAAAFAQTPSYCVQVAASAVLFVITGTMIDRSGLRKMIKQ